MPSNDSTALPKQAEQIFRNRNTDLRLLCELYCDVTARREDTEIGAVVHDTRGNRIGKAASQCHELVATVIAGSELRERLECAIVESPPNVFNDSHDAARTLRDRKAARHLNLRAALESQQELRESAWQKACVGVDKDEDVATESGEDCVERGRLPASLRLADQARSGLDHRPILDDALCIIRATARHDEDLVQGKPGWQALGRKRLEQRGKPLGLVVCANPDADPRLFYGSRVAAGSGRDERGILSLAQQPIRCRTPLFNEAEVEACRPNDFPARVARRLSDFKNHRPGDAQSRLRALKDGDFMAFDVHLQPINPSQPDTPDQLIQRQSFDADVTFRFPPSSSAVVAWV